MSATTAARNPGGWAAGIHALSRRLPRLVLPGGCRQHHAADFVYGLLKTRVPPEINAISTIMLVISTALVAVSIAIQGRNASRGNR